MYNNQYIFEEPEQNEDERNVQVALLKATDYLSKLLQEASRNLLCDQYELYKKNFTFLKFIMSLMNELQELFENFKKQENNIRISDVEKKIEEIMKHIKEYELPEQENHIQDLSKKSSDTDLDDDLMW